ncbi:MAG TPA: C45 family peptidase [Streptosporangiaceae bacterium]|jgi:isopenicillin-N N-acyltransferase-like protein
MNPAGGPGLLVVEGTYEQMGEAIGAATADLVGGNLEAYQRRFRDEAGLSDADVRRWGGRYQEVAGRYDTDIRAMLDGLASGAGQPPEYIYALNARTEMLYGTAYKDEGCTSIAVLNSRTADGHTLLAQNWDWNAEQGPVTFLLATRDTEGFSVLTLAEAGMLAKSGLNSAGLGVCANLLISDADRGGDGVPYHLLLRGVLQSRTMADAHRAVLPQPRISSGNLLIADAGGEAIDFEVAPGDFGYVLPDDGLITHANHFDSAIGVKDLKRDTAALTLLRPVRARHLLERALSDRAVTIADIQSTLRDHYSYPDAICRHVNPTDESRICSVYSVVMDLDTRELSIASHPICDHPYATWPLAEIFAAARTNGTPWLKEMTPTPAAA